MVELIQVDSGPKLEAVRALCVSLARLRHDFADPDVRGEPYFKVERGLPGQHLEPLRATVVPLDRASLVRATHAVTRFYQQVVPDLAKDHGITYPASLEAIFAERLDALSAAEDSRLGKVSPG